MKLTHEMCNQFFQKLDISTKRQLVNILSELKSAEEKHPVWTHDPIHAAAIVGEECGELLRAAIQHTYEEGRYYDIHKEAIQCGAMAIRLLINLPEIDLPGEPIDLEPNYQQED